jgi:hypothetical protein
VAGPTNYYYYYYYYYYHYYYYHHHHHYYYYYYHHHHHYYYYHHHHHYYYYYNYCYYYYCYYYYYYFFFSFFFYLLLLPSSSSPSSSSSSSLGPVSLHPGCTPALGLLYNPKYSIQHRFNSPVPLIKRQRSLTEVVLVSFGSTSEFQMTIFPLIGPRFLYEGNIAEATEDFLVVTNLQK